MKSIYKVSRPFLGVSCFLLGIIISFTPLPFGSLVMLTGIIMTSPEIKFCRSLLSWIQDKDPTKKQYLGRLIHTLQLRLIPEPARTRIINN